MLKNRTKPPKRVRLMEFPTRHTWLNKAVFHTVLSGDQRSDINEFVIRFPDVSGTMRPVQVLLFDIMCLRIYCFSLTAVAKETTLGLYGVVCVALYCAYGSPGFR